MEGLIHGGAYFQNFTVLILYHVEYYARMYVDLLQFQPSGSTFLGFKDSFSQFSCNINALLGREVKEIEKILNLGTVMIHRQKLTDQGQFLFLYFYKISINFFYNNKTYTGNVKTWFIFKSTKRLNHKRI